jgi:hypothetical protein
MSEHRSALFLARRFAMSLTSLAAFGAMTGVAAAQTVIPTQYIAKLYTEALGRAPDQTGWSRDVAYFQTKGCTAASLAAIGASVYNSNEFAGDVTDSETEIVALFRGALNRDPDPASIALYVRQIANGTPFSTVVGTVFASPEFLGNLPTYCGPNPDYGFGAQAPAVTTPGAVGYNPAVGYGGAKGEAGLQALLVCAETRKCPNPVYIAQKAVVYLTSTLHIPQTVTLSTEGQPSPRHYTQMARLVRASSFNGPNIQVDGSGSISNLWVDGQRNVLGYNNPGMNVMTLGGTGTVVSFNKLVEPQGGSNIISTGAQTGSACVKETIINNLLTGYTTVHGYSTPADGMTMQCENLDIENNQIVDMSDVGIVLFGSVKVNQASKIINNTIVSAGNSMTAAISADQISGNTIPGPGQYICYEGTLFSGNTFWTGPYTTFDFGIEAGAREFFKTTDPREVDASCADGGGPVYTNNTTGSLSAQVRAGIAVAGMMNVTITNDAAHPLNFLPVAFPKLTPAAACPAALVMAEVNEGHASGNFPAPTVDENFDFCTVHMMP